MEPGASLRVSPVKTHAANPPNEPSIPWLLMVAIMAFIAVYITLDIGKLHALRYGSDTGVFTQSLINFVRHGSTYNGAEHRPHLLVHDSWAILLVSPLVAIWPHPETLLCLQVIAFGSAAAVLFAVAREFGCSSNVATIVAILYLASPATQGVAYDNITENAYVPLLGFSLAWALQKRKMVLALVFAELLLGVKEDEAIFVAWIGILYAIWTNRRTGVIMTMLAISNGLLFLLLEHLNGSNPSIPSYHFGIDHPLDALFSILAIALPFGFAPVTLGRRIFYALPFVIELTSNNHWGSGTPLYTVGSHYVVPLATLVAIGAAQSIAKRPKIVRLAIPCTILAVLFLSPTPLRLGRWPYIVDPIAYSRALALRDSANSAVVSSDDEGAYAVASSKLNLEIETGAMHHPCPAFNKNGRAFLASIGIGTWPRDVTLCGGVAVPRSSRTDPS